MGEFWRALVRPVTWRMARRNVWRSPRRTLVVLAAITVGLGGVMLAMAVNYGMVVQMVDTAIRNELGHVQVHGAGWHRKPGVEIRLPAARVEAALADAPAELQAVAPRVRGEGLASSAHGNAGVSLVAIDPEREVGVTRLHEALVAGDWLGSGRRRALIGGRLADRLKLDVGDKLVVTAQDVHGEITGEAFRVGGVFQTASQEVDERIVLIALADGQRILAMPGELSELALAARSDREADALRDAVAARLPAEWEIESWHELRPLLRYMVDAFEQIGWVIYAAVFVAMAFGIANVLLMSVYERTREIGIMSAIGMKPGRVVALLLAESWVLTLLGVALGVATGLAGVVALSGGIDLTSFSEGLTAYGIPPRIVPVLPLRDLAIPVVIASVTALVAGAWPAVRAVRTLPAEAVRHV